MPIDVNTFGFVGIAIAAVFGTGIGYGGAISIYAVLGWLNRRSQWKLSTSAMAFMKLISIAAVMAFVLYLEMLFGDWHKIFEGEFRTYVFRSFVFAHGLGIFLVSRSSTYRRFMLSPEQKEFDGEEK